MQPRRGPFDRREMRRVAWRVCRPALAWARSDHRRSGCATASRNRLDYKRCVRETGQRGDEPPMWIVSSRARRSTARRRPPLSVRVPHIKTLSARGQRHWVYDYAGSAARDDPHHASTIRPTGWHDSHWSSAASVAAAQMRNDDSNSSLALRCTIQRADRTDGKCPASKR